MGNVDKLSIAAMKKTAAELGLKLPAGDPKKAAEILRKHFLENYEMDTLTKCGVCGFESHEDFESCPYCGIDFGEEAVEEAPAKKSKKPSPAKKAKKAKVEEEETAIETPDPKLVEEITERVNRIKSLRQDLVRNSYQIGQELKEINDKQLFKSMGHKSFLDFCKRELEYSRVMAYKYMSLCAFSEEDALLIGPTKADLIANAGTPSKDGELNRKQKKLLDMARNGASRTDLQKELNKGKQAPPKEEGITLVARVREREIFVDWTSEKTGKPCTRDIKNKFAEFELVSNIFVRIVESQKGDGLVLMFRKGAELPQEPDEPEEVDDTSDEDEED